MSDEQSQRQDNQLELQQHDGQVISVPLSFLILVPCLINRAGQDDEPEGPEPQQRDGQVVLPPHLLVFRVTILVIQFTCKIVLDHINSHYLRTPFHTSALSGEAWVNELLTGHPQRIRSVLGISRSTFILLVKSLQALGVNSSRHISIEEQLSIFLYTVVTGMSCTQVSERFQHSPSTITK
jgi:hypothetical protein